MRDHSTIVRDVGALALVRILARGGTTVSPSTPQRWADRDSIPSEYWQALVRAGAATLEELALAAEARKAIATPQEQEAA